MKSVSTAWNENHRGQIVGEGFVEINFSFEDRMARQFATVTSPQPSAYSDTGQIATQREALPERYGTMESNLWLLDGSMKQMDPDNTGYLGYISQYLSGSTGIFSNPPVISIKFSSVRTTRIPGMTIRWSESLNEYPTDYSIAFYNDGSQVASGRLTDNTNPISTIMVSVQDYDEIKITINRWCLPYHRVRISTIYFGVFKLYTRTELFEYKHESINDPLSGRIPQESINFEVNNISGEYDATDEEGLFGFLKEQIPVNVRYGYKLDNDIEWINVGTYYMSEWSAPQNGLTAKFGARDAFAWLNDPIPPMSYGNTFGQYLFTIMESANVPYFEEGDILTWDEELNTIRPYCVWSKSISCGEFVQLVANANAYSIFITEAGGIHLGKFAPVDTDYTINTFNSFSRPEVELTKKLKAVEVVYTTVQTDEVDREVFRGEVTATQEGPIRLELSTPVVDLSISTIPASSASFSRTHMYGGTYILPAGTYDVTVTGTTLKQVDNVVTIPTKAGEGDIQRIENPMITTAARATTVGTWVRDYLKNRRKVSVDFRIDPKLEALDRVVIQDRATPLTVQTESFTVKYAGSFKGEYHGRVIDDMA